MEAIRAAAFLGSLAVLISAFLPWASFTLPFGTLTITGIEGNHGYVALAIGMGGLVLAYYKSKYVTLAGILALVLATVEIIDMANSMESREMMESKGITAAIGSGIYVLVGGGIALVIAGVLLTKRH